MMNRGKLIFIFVFWLQSCSNKPEVREASAGILDQFKNDIVESIHNRNEKGDSISEEIILDTLYLERLNVKDYRLAFAQYHSFDRKLDLAILGIENFRSGNTPTFLLVDYRSKQYFIDSLKVVRDSLYVYCNSRLLGDSTEVEKFRIGFDLEFNGDSFPWSMERLDRFGSIKDNSIIVNAVKL